RRRVESRRYRREGAALQPGSRSPLVVGSRLQVHGGHGVVIVVLDVVLAAPGYLYRLADLLGEKSRFGHVIRFRFTTETATQERHMTDDVLFGDPQCPGQGLLHTLRVLGRGPDSDLAVLELGYRRRRFHGGMG